MGNPSTLSVRMHIGAAIVEGNIELPQKLKMRKKFITHIYTFFQVEYITKK